MDTDIKASPGCGFTRSVNADNNVVKSLYAKVGTGQYDSNHFFVEVVEFPSDVAVAAKLFNLNGNWFEVARFFEEEAKKASTLPTTDNGQRPKLRGEEFHKRIMAKMGVKPWPRPDPPSQISETSRSGGSPRDRQKVLTFVTSKLNSAYFAKQKALFWKMLAEGATVEVLEKSTKL